MKLDLRVGVFLALLSAAYVACEICSKLDSCEDARIRAFLTEKGQTVTKFQAQQLHTTEVKQSNGQVLPAASKNLFQLDITKSTTSQVAECTEELKSKEIEFNCKNLPFIVPRIKPKKLHTCIVTVSCAQLRVCVPCILVLSQCPSCVQLLVCVPY